MALGDWVVNQTPGGVPRGFEGGRPRRHVDSVQVILSPLGLPPPLAYSLFRTCYHTA